MTTCAASSVAPKLALIQKFEKACAVLTVGGGGGGGGGGLPPAPAGRTTAACQ